MRVYRVEADRLNVSSPLAGCRFTCRRTPPTHHDLIHPGASIPQHFQRSHRQERTGDRGASSLAFYVTVLTRQTLAVVS